MKVLIVDDEADIRDVIASSLEVYIDEVECLFAKSGKDAIEVLSQDSNIDAVICDYNMPHGNGGDVFNYILDNNIETQYVFCSSDLVQSKSEFKGKQDRVLCHIVKPDVFQGIEEFVKKMEALNTPYKKNTSDYCKVPINLLLLFEKLPCDVYLQLSEEKTLKVFNQNEIFSKDDLSKYEDKKIYSLYVGRDCIKCVLDQVSQRLVEVLKTGEPSVEKGLDVQQLVLEIGQSLGFSKEIIEKASPAISKTVEMIQVDKVTEQKLKTMFKYRGSYIARHSIAVGYLSVAVVQGLIWDTEDARVKLAQAAFFHDLGIEDITFDESESDVSMVENHPVASVEVYKAFKYNLPDVENIILEQHELPNGQGKPRGLVAEQIRPLCAIFVFSHLMVNAMISLNKQKAELTHKSLLNYIKDMGITFEVAPFSKIEQSFLKLKLFEG